MFWDMQNCPMIQRTLKKALNLDQNRCRITYAKLNNALTSKIDILLPEVDADKLLHEISVANLCDVIGSVTVKGTNKWQSVQLIKAYNDLRMSAAQPIAQPNNDEMSDVEPINSEPPTSAHHIISYSKILARGLEHKLEKLNARTENRKQPNRAAAPPQQRNAGNNDDAKESDANHTSASQPNDHPSNDHRSRKRQRQSDEPRSNEVIQLTQMITEMKQTQAEMLKELRETRSRNNVLESTVQLLTTAIATLISNQSGNNPILSALSNAQRLLMPSCNNDEFNQRIPSPIDTTNASSQNAAHDANSQPPANEANNSTVASGTNPVRRQQSVASRTDATAPTETIDVSMSDARILKRSRDDSIEPDIDEVSSNARNDRSTSQHHGKRPTTSRNASADAAETASVDKMNE
jgi:hypothetical protein